MRTTRPYGPTAFLVQADNVEVVLRLRSLPRPAGVLQTIPGARSLVVECVPSASSAVVRAAERYYATTSELPAGPITPGRVVEIPVRYDGSDLAEVAARTRLSIDEVVNQHAAAAYHVALCGFTPGFAYIAGLPTSLHLPRRSSPRERVPAGAVAIAGEWTGIYPRATPGGWHLLGTTTAPLWNPAAEPPALLQPGDLVRFVAL